MRKKHLLIKIINKKLLLEVGSQKIQKFQKFQKILHNEFHSFNKYNFIYTNFIKLHFYF